MPSGRRVVRPRGGITNARNKQHVTVGIETNRCGILISGTAAKAARSALGTPDTGEEE